MKNILQELLDTDKQFSSYSFEYGSAEAFKKYLTLDAIMLPNNQNVVTNEFSLYPNPATDKLYVNLKDTSTEIYYVTIATVEGRIVMMLPQPEWQNGIDISSLASGVYTFQMMDKHTKSITTKKFIKK